MIDEVTREDLTQRVSGLEQDLRKIASGQAVLETEVKSIALGQRDLLDGIRTLQTSISNSGKPNWGTWISSISLGLLMMTSLAGLFILPANQSIASLTTQMDTQRDYIKYHTELDGHSVALLKNESHEKTFESMQGKLNNLSGNLKDLKTHIERERDLKDTIEINRRNSIAITLKNEMEQRDLYIKEKLMHEVDILSLRLKTIENKK